MVAGRVYYQLFVSFRTHELLATVQNNVCIWFGTIVLRLLMMSNKHHKNIIYLLGWGIILYYIRDDPIT